ncbi:MAG: hypothetical protein Q9163_001421 [Psora crenata]
MAEACSLYDKTVAVMPTYEREQSTLLAAVLKAEKSSLGELDCHDFLWVKCRAVGPFLVILRTLSFDSTAMRAIEGHCAGPYNTLAVKIYEQCEVRRFGSGCWILNHGGKPVDLGTTLTDLDTHGDGLVVFEAVIASDTVRLLPSEVAKRSDSARPLSPEDSNHHMQSRLQKLASSCHDVDTLPSLASREKENTYSPKPPSSDPPSSDVPALEMGAARVSATQPASTAPYPTAKYSQIRPSNDAARSASGETGFEQGNAGPQYDVLTPDTGDYSVSQPPASILSSSGSPKVGERPTGHATSPNTSSGPSCANPDKNMDVFERSCGSSIDQTKAARSCETRTKLEGPLEGVLVSMDETDRDSYRPPLSLAAADTIATGEISSGIPRASRFKDGKDTSSHVHETSIASAAIEKQKYKSFQLPALLKDAAPQILEASVEASLELLNTLKVPLSKKLAKDPDAEQWVQQIDNIKEQAVKTKTVIGVVGTSGVGKSSVINAILDEERLVPTNCMRACTAVVTEISYNEGCQPYRAEIEYISPADWERELKLLFQDLLDGDGNVFREFANENANARIAYAKIKAVYPHKTIDDLAKSNIETMLRDVSHILGNITDIEETDSFRFYRKLQDFIDSKQKSTSNKDKEVGKDERKREFWPLIRVVRLYVRSPALATGAVIVDLPGINDANAARAAVAESYMKQCTGICHERSAELGSLLRIVAPITRAVDDDAAKSLLDESFKRQLKMDGGFNAITFICSKTDDICLMEAQDTLGLDERMCSLCVGSDQLAAKRKSLVEEFEEMKKTEAVYEETTNDADDQIDVWETLKESADNGKIVYEPRCQSASNKRKSNTEGKLTNKKQRTRSTEIEDRDFAEENKEEEDNGESEEQKPLTEEQVKAKLEELKTTKKEGKIQKRVITEKMAKIWEEIEEAENAEREIEGQKSALCISERNEYSRRAIQQDFAAGIKELDQEIEEDEENFNPAAEFRDYEEVARSLPVFCVSSRGYQKLSGRLCKDHDVPGFTSIEQTEIPQLQAHCEKLTEKGRAAGCRAFINRLSQLFNSLTLWATSEGSEATLMTEQKAGNLLYLQKGLDRLKTDLQNAIEATCGEFKEEINHGIFDKYGTAITKAVESSIDTALKWGAAPNRHAPAAGGIHWVTYKAICRRYGCFTNHRVKYDMNLQLTKPMIKHLASGWEEVFTLRIQHVMHTFTGTVGSALQKFHRDLQARVRMTGNGIASLSMLTVQVGVYEQILKDLAVSAKHAVKARQKDINREFVPVVEKAMRQAYIICQEEHGTGSFSRMKAAMNSHVDERRHDMFQGSATHVKNQLTGLIQYVKKILADKTDEVFAQIERDYRSVLGGEKMSHNNEVSPSDQQQVRREILQILAGVEKTMKRIVGTEVDEDSDEDKGNESPAGKPERKGEDFATG